MRIRAVYACLWAVTVTAPGLASAAVAAAQSMAAMGATVEPTCLRSPQLAACHHRADGSFTVTRQDSPPPEAFAEPYHATTTLAGCDIVAGSPEVTLSTLDDQLAGQRWASVEMVLHASKRVRCPGGMEAIIEDTLTNETNSSFRWDIKVSSSSSGFWTAPIASTVSFPGHTDDLQYWFGGSTSGGVDLGPIEFGKCDSIKGDPELPAGTCDFKYGGDYADPTTPPNEVWTNQLVLPIWSYYNSTAGPRAGSGAVALVQSPLLAHAPVFARLKTYAGESVATFTYSRELSRLGNGTDPVLFSQQLLHTEADWRPAVGWMVERFPEFFFSNASANIAHMEGAGAYADYRGAGVDATYKTRLQRMNFGINWDAVFPYPFHGMWMPYEPYYNQTWENCFIHPSYDHQPSPFNVTHAWVASYYRAMQDLGFHSCTYANWFEFGWNISSAAPKGKLECSMAFLSDQAACNARSQCRANQIFWEHFEPAAVRQWAGGPQWPSEIPGKDDSHGKGSVAVGDLLRPTGCLGSPCALMDPGHEAYKRHLLAMAKTMIELAPSSGLCVDRQDMVGGVINDRADDGRTYYTSNASKISAEGEGVVGRSSMFSVMELLESMGDLMHSAGKGIMVNTHTSRIDMFRHVDGVFDEHGDTADNMKVTALNSLAMPAVIWNHGAGNGDKYLQQHLYFGVNCMVPFPDNDHSIHDTTTKSTRAFEDYGPMFAQLRSKQWVLVAHAAAVADGRAKANFFKTSLVRGTQSYAAPVVLAEPNVTSVDVTLRCDAGSKARAARESGVTGCGDIPKHRLIALVMHPGVEPSPLNVDWGSDGQLVFRKLPLSRGCAMIVLRDSMDPSPPPGPPPLPPAPAPTPAGGCTAGCTLKLVVCNISNPLQIFTYDGRHLHNVATSACLDMNKATLSVGLWSPCEKVAEDDQWWSFAVRNDSSGSLSGLLEMKGAPVHGKAPCLDVASGSLKASVTCDTKKSSQQWTLVSPRGGSVLRNSGGTGGLCIGM